MGPKGRSRIYKAVADPTKLPEYRNRTLWELGSNGCPFCGQPHPDMAFHKMEAAVETYYATYTHYGVCPATNKPVLLAFVPNDSTEEEADIEEHPDVALLLAALRSCENDNLRRDAVSALNRLTGFGLDRTAADKEEVGGE